MNINIENMNDGQINRIEALIADIRKENARKPLAWKPRFNEQCFYINVERVSSTIFEDLPFDTLVTFDTLVINAGNCFPTKELAEAELERRKVIREIEELVDKYDSERGGAFIVGETNYTFYYQADYDRVFIKIEDTETKLLNPMLPCFSSFDTAREIRDEVGEDRVKLLFTKYPIVRDDA